LNGFEWVENFQILKKSFISIKIHFVCKEKTSNLVIAKSI